MLRRLSVAVVLLFVLTSCLRAQSDRGEPHPTIDQLSWIVGHWRGEENGRVTEEVWMAPSGGMMLGMNRAVSAGRPASFESLRIVQQGKRINYLASPGGRAATSFALKTLKTNEVVFENPEHDFPNRVVYRRDGAKLTARIEGVINGKQTAMQWNWSQDKPMENRATAKPNGILKGIETIAYRVEDLEKAKKWYTDVLGVEPHFDKPYYVGFQVGGKELGLDPDVKGLVRGNNQPAYWRVENCDQAFRMLLEKGAKTGSEPQDVGDGVKVATVIDPFGNTLGIVETPAQD